MVLKGVLLDTIWLIFLLLMLWYFWRDRQQLKEGQTWSVTKGRITQFHWARQNHHLWPKIEYVYQVGEQDFTGELFFFNTTHTSTHSHYARMLAYRTAIAFDKDEDIDVFYNPMDPSQAVLDVSIPKKLTVIIGLLIFLIALHLLVVGYHLWMK